MSFTPTNFQDLPSTATPIDAAEMNKLGTQHAAAVADSAAQVPGLVDNALSTDAVIRAAADTAVSDAIAAEGGITDPTIAAALSDTASDSRGVLDATFARGDQRPNPFPRDFAAYSKGGSVGTSGRSPVAIRFDDWQDNIVSLGLIAELTNRGLFGSIALCTELGSNPWNTGITWATLRDWNINSGMEFWSHGTDHNSPYSADPATNYANLTREIVTSRATIEAQGIRCMGWAMPGVGEPGYGSFLMTPADWQTEAGRLLTATYGLVETDMTSTYRNVPGNLHYGLGHFTVSDGKTLQQSKDTIDGAIALGRGLELMCHAGNLGLAGNITYAEFKTLLDYIVTKRDAGLIEFVTPSTLPFCNFDSARRLDFIGNSNMEAAVPLNATTIEGNWLGVDGTARYITSVADGRAGVATKVLHCSGNALVTQATSRTIGRGISGQTLILDAWVRCIQVNSVVTSSVRFVAQDSTTPANFTFDKSAIPVTTTWQRLRIPFSAPPTTDNLAFAIGRGSTVGTGQIEWDDVHVYVA